MKKFAFVPALALVAFAGLSSCSDDDNDLKPSKVPSVVTEAFQAQYPGARSVEWESKADYYIADFTDNNLSKEAWYEQSGKWAMTESDYGRNVSLVPAAVAATIQLPAYETYTLDDIDYYERVADSFYLVDLDNNATGDIDLVIAPDGTLIKTLVDTGRDYVVLPTTDISNL